MSERWSFKVSEPFMLRGETLHYGPFELACQAFERHTNGNGKPEEEYITIFKAWPTDTVPLVRVESLCNFGHIFNSNLCNCSPQLEDAVAQIREEGGLVMLIMHQDGRGASLVQHANAFALQQNKGVDTVESYQLQGIPVDRRKYEGAARILRLHFGLTQVRLLTNNPDKIKTLGTWGLQVKPVNSLVPLDLINPDRARQLTANAGKEMKHQFPAEYLAAVLDIAKKNGRPQAGEARGVLETIQNMKVPAGR